MPTSTLRQPFVLWFTGLPAAGKTTISTLIADQLERAGVVAEHLDGDVVRTHLSRGLGFSKEDRDINVERVAWVASRLARAGAPVLVSMVSPYAESRQRARNLVEEHAAFIEVHVATPLEQCVDRDPKGMYARAYAGELSDFTGVSAPYEEPIEPELRLETTDRDVGDCVAEVWSALKTRGLLN
ncbi:MAG: adenylyl-sulfate kinase [Gaiellaceae bacterium]